MVWITSLIVEIALWISGIVFALHNDFRDNARKRICISILILLANIVAIIYIMIQAPINVEFMLHLCVYIVMSALIYVNWKVSYSIAVYLTIWAVICWQIIFEICDIWNVIPGTEFGRVTIIRWGVMVLLFAIGYIVVAFTISKWLLSEGRKTLGPRQMISAILLFLIFELSAYSMHIQMRLQSSEDWRTLFMTQILVAFILYLQNELFKKSVIRQELAMMNLLWKKEQEQYQLSKENIALINHKCHDLKHQIRALRDASKEDMDQYLNEIEDSIKIYESIVKTGNEVLDTILTEKSLYCKDRGIKISCVVDGNQMDFINKVDLYTILGNALDNAIEAVEKFKHQEMRQIDVMIYKQQQFLVINIINPMKEQLIYEEELPVTTKGDKRYHGFGLKSMKYVVKKYDGFLTVSEEDGCFSLKILMPIPK